MLSVTNAFLNYWALGYHKLVPIVPPDAALSAKSSLSKRINTRSDPRGKAPGVRGQNGDWHSFDWLKYEADEQDCQRWATMGAGVGIRTSARLLAIDADTLDDARALTIRDIIRQHLGDTPVRVGNYPKALYLVRCSEDYRYTRVEFGAINERGYLEDRVEILAEGRQFVAHGIHPKTQKPYSWPRPIVPLDQLPTFTAAQIDSLMSALHQALPAAKDIIREGAASDVNQAALRGDPEMVRKAVAAMPNTSEYFPTREAFVQIGYAIRASMPDDPHGAFDLYAEWAERWAEGDNEPDFVAAEWSRMKPPYKIGAGWLYEQAERTSKGKFRETDAWFAPLEDEPENPFAQVRQQEAAASKPDPVGEMAAGIHVEPYRVPIAADIQPRQWIYGTQYIRKFASATIAPTAVGKSSLGIVEALAMVTGKPLLGVEPKGIFKVWIWNGEDPMDELDRRVAAAMLHYGLTQDDLGDRLFMASGRQMSITVAVDTKDGTRILEPVVGAIETAIAANGVDVMIVDPFVSSHRVSENDNNAIDTVAKRWGKVADRCRCAIELVHHSRKLNGGVATVEDSRGAGALMNAVRPARAIMKMQAIEAQALGVSEPWRYFRFVDGKNNLAPPVLSAGGAGGAGGSGGGLAGGLGGLGGADWMQMRSVDLGNGDSVGVVCHVEPGMMTEMFTDGEVEAALTLIGMAEWRYDIRSGARWIGIPIAAAIGLDLDEDGNKKRVKDMISDWVKQKRLEIYEAKDDNRVSRTFVRQAEKPTAYTSNFFD